MEQTGARLLVACLEANGFRRAYGVPGESYLDLLDALRDSRIQYVTCRHEGGAAMAAAAHGQLTGQPGLCMVTRGPGATNASAGLHLARQGGLPMLLLIGQAGRGERHRETFQEIEYPQMLGELTKWNAEIWDANRIPEMVAHAAAAARSGRPGPVALSLPEDMLGDAASGRPMAAAEPPKGAIAPATLARLKAMLRSAKKPLLIVGGIGWTAAASAALGKFAWANDIPVAFGFRAQDCLDNLHPCAVGSIGIGGSPDLGERLRETDLIIALGVRLGDGTMPKERLLTDAAKPPRIAHFHPEGDEIGRVVQPQLGGVVASVDAAIQLGSVKTGYPPERKAWRKALRKDYEAYSTPEAGAVGLLGRMVAEMDRQLPDNAVLCNGAGNFAHWLHRYYRYRRPGTGLGPVSGSMGYDVPAALAAALEKPDRPVIAWAGDGSFLMTGQELATAVQYGARLCVVVVDNGQYGTIRMHQEQRFPGRVSGTQIRNPDFAALARSYGALGETAKDMRGFQNALRKCLKHDGPSLIHLPVDPRVIVPGKVIEQDGDQG